MIHLISGKGGVGKSMVAASLAWHLASRGRKTLLVELGERSYFRHVLNAEISATPVALNTHLAVARWEGEACLREYLQHIFKIERMVSLFFNNKVMRTLVQAAPGLREISLLGKLTSKARKIGPTLAYDEIVVDAYATGHFRALWRSAIGLSEAIAFGPMGDQSRGILRVLKNPDETRFYVVLLPEELPLTEGLELAADIQKELEQIPQLIANRWLKCPLTISQLNAFRGHDFADYLRALCFRQEEAERVLSDRSEQVQYLPWIFSSSSAEKIRQLAGSWEASK